MKKTFLNEKAMRAEQSYEFLVELHQFVTMELGQKSVIIDADDLQRDPGLWTNHKGSKEPGRSLGCGQVKLDPSWLGSLGEVLGPRRRGSLHSPKDS